MVKFQWILGIVSVVGVSIAVALVGGISLFNMFPETAGNMTAGMVSTARMPNLEDLPPEVRYAPERLERLERRREKMEVKAEMKKMMFERISSVVVPTDDILSHGKFLGEVEIEGGIQTTAHLLTDAPHLVEKLVDELGILETPPLKHPYVVIKGEFKGKKSCQIWIKEGRHGKLVFLIPIPTSSSLKDEEKLVAMSTK